MDGEQCTESSAANGSSDDQDKQNDPYGSDNEEDEFDDPCYRDLTPEELFRIKGVARLLVQDQRLIGHVLAAVDSGPTNQSFPSLSRKYKLEVMRVVFLHFRDCSPGWLTKIFEFLNSETTKLAYLSQVPGIDQRRRPYQGGDWDVGFGRRFLNQEADPNAIWPFIRPAILLAIQSLPLRVRKRNRTGYHAPPKSMLAFIHSLMKNKKPETGEWVSFKIPAASKAATDAMVAHIVYITAKPATTTKLKRAAKRIPAELPAHFWKAGEVVLALGKWKPRKWPFYRLKAGFHMLQKHVETTAYPGDRSWNFEVYVMIETFAEGSSRFPDWTESGLKFTRKRSRKQFVTYSFEYLTSNYFQGKMLEFMGFFSETVEEHFAGTCLESLWFNTLEHHKIMGTENHVRDWLQAIILAFLPDLLDVFVDIMGWDKPDPKSLVAKRETTSPDATRSNPNNKSRRRRQRGEVGQPKSLAHANAAAGPSTLPILPLPKRKKRKAGQDASDPSTFLFPDHTPTSYILEPSSILNSAYLHQKPKKSKKSKNKGKNKRKMQISDDPVPEFPIAGHTRAGLAASAGSAPGSANTPTPSSSVNPAPALPLQQSEAVDASSQASSDLPDPSSSITASAPSSSSSSVEPGPALHPQGSKASSSPSQPELKYPNLVWISHRLQASFSFNSDSSLSPDSSLDSMQSLTDAINNIDPDKGFNVFHVDENAGNGESSS